MSEHEGQLSLSDKLSKENLLKMEPELLRAIIRERSHHTIESSLYQVLKGKASASERLGNAVAEIIGIWEERGLSLDEPDLKWAQHLLEIVEKIKEGEKPKIHMKHISPLSRDDLKIIEYLIFQRRSIRSWTKEKVPKELLLKMVEAAQWAPMACNTQTIRVKIIDDEEGLNLFQSWPAKGASAILVFCQYSPAYNFFPWIPTENHGYDCGAAVQNAILMAHALGLGAVWLTFTGNQKDQFRKHYELPEEYHVSTYIAVGWPDENPIAPGRMKTSDVLL